MGKLINRIPGWRLLISSLPGSALRAHVESLGKPSDSTSVLKDLPGKLDIKRHSPSTLCLFHHILQSQFIVSCCFLCVRVISCWSWFCDQDLS